MPDKTFTFEISLSVLNHLGRNLYRNFITVIGEAISNSWDADSKNVWIIVDRDNGEFSISDDGTGMDDIDFQTKFLRIGYSKRSDGSQHTQKGRPYIGAKGIGKLALLSSAERVSIISKKKQKPIVGGVIDNSGLDDAIKHDLTPDQYELESLEIEKFRVQMLDYENGTTLLFEGLKDNIRQTIPYLKKLIALNFRFSVIDEEFSIFVNEELVSLDDLSGLSESTEFVWKINGYYDEFVSSFRNLESEPLELNTPLQIRGFVASVKLPRHLKVTGTDERVSIDLFVNGRLREKNILSHIPTQRIVESYLYGQIHFDSMDTQGRDPFTSSREGIVEDDENFQSLLDWLRRTAIPKIFDDWDRKRLERGEEGDADNKRKSKKERKARDLYSAAAEEYDADSKSKEKDQVDAWIEELRNDAEFNVSAYVDCFLSENLVRKCIGKKGHQLHPNVMDNADNWRANEEKYKNEANISFEIRRDADDLSYLGMDDLAFSAEGKKPSTKNVKSLWTDAISYKPVRNVVGHTGLLTETAKNHLRLKFENIKARVKNLIHGV